MLIESKKSSKESELERLKKENMELKNEVERLKSELNVSQKNIQTLKSLVFELQADVGKKEYELHQKNKIIEHISQDLERFGKEIDSIISYFEINKIQEPTQEEPDIIKSKTFGIDRELLFGINVDIFFLKSAPIDTVKYYLIAIGCVEYFYFEFEGLMLKNRYEFELVAQAFVEYAKLKSANQNIEIVGVIQIHTRDLFNSPKIEFWGNNAKLVENLLTEFTKEFNLSGEIQYAYFEIN